MVEGTKALINFGELSKPATVLIEKISEAVGGLFKPYQIKRVARATAEASKIKAQTDIEISEIQQRAFIRFINEETRKQINMEEITAKAINYLPEDSKPEDIDDDWLSNFFEKSRIISDKEMQILWAKILAGEANKKNSFSNRTINMVAELDKSDAQLFKRLCSFCWKLEKDFFPIILGKKIEFYKNHGIRYSDIKHLDSIGLVNHQPTGYTLGDIEGSKLTYFKKPLNLSSSKEIPIGDVILTRFGRELFPIVNAKKIPDVYNFISSFYKKENLIKSL